MMTRMMLNLRDPKLKGGSEECRLTPIRFNGQGQTSSEVAGDASTNTRRDESVWRAPQWNGLGYGLIIGTSDASDNVMKL